MCRQYNERTPSHTSSVMLVVAALVNVTMWAVLAVNIAYLTRRHRGSVPDDERHPDVTIVIPARNEAKNLAGLLPSLLGQTYPIEEIIVYDDGSDDDTEEVVRRHADGRITLLRGTGPPPGWLGKPHALYQATRNLSTDLVLFLDADVAFRRPDSLGHVIKRYRLLPPRSVMTALIRPRGAGLLLVSHITLALLAALPWPAARWTRWPLLGGLNGQCWILDTQTYRRLEPHRHVRKSILEDVEIGRYLLSNGVVPELADARDHLEVTMYASFAEAWMGFQKNAYLLMTGRLVPFLLLLAVYIVTFLIAPLNSTVMLASLWMLKLATDRFGRFPLWVSLAAPASFLLGAFLLADSAVAHWRGNVVWKGRQVSGHRTPDS